MTQSNPQPPAAARARTLEYASPGLVRRFTRFREFMILAIILAAVIGMTYSIAACSGVHWFTGLPGPSW